jgi:hypothetical protein
LVPKAVKAETYRATIVPVVLYGCETWFVALTERQRLVLANRCGSKRDEVTGEWRQQYSEQLHDLHILPNITAVIRIRKMRWAGNLLRMGEKRGAYRALVGKP